jgi:hypothetical protein
LQWFAVVCSGFDPIRAILVKLDAFIISYLGHYVPPENLLHLIRNQQVAGSIPAGGSILSIV